MDTMSTVTLDPDKFPGLRGMTFVVTSAPRRDADAGRDFVVLALTTDPGLIRTAYVDDLVEATPTSRTYAVGLPVLVTVHDDGRVEYAVDRSEAGQAIREDTDDADDDWMVERASDDADLVDADYAAECRREWAHDLGILAARRGPGWTVDDQGDYERLIALLNR